MDMSPKEYQQYVQQKSQKSPIVKDVVLAFIIGGLICVVRVPPPPSAWCCCRPC